MLAVCVQIILGFLLECFLEKIIAFYFATSVDTAPYNFGPNSHAQKCHYVIAKKNELYSSILFT